MMNNGVLGKQLIFTDKALNHNTGDGSWARWTNLHPKLDPVYTKPRVMAGPCYLQQVGAQIVHKFKHVETFDKLACVELHFVWQWLNPFPTKDDTFHGNEMGNRLVGKRLINI